MNHPISWDPSLVKKFSSSNHYKLLNQLRNEVKKYPLNNKKKTSSIQCKDSNVTKIDNSNLSNQQNKSYANESNQSSEIKSNKSTISFNNAKNFSIYNQNKNTIRQNEVFIPDPSNSIQDSSTHTFKQRLDQIDMK